MSQANKKNIIIGCGAQCKYIIDIFSLTGATIEEILDPVGKKAGGRLNDLHIRLLDRAKIHDRLKSGSYSVIIGVSDNLLKKELFRLLEQSAQFTDAIHPASVVSSLATVGRGVIINAGAVIQPYAVVGNGVMIHAGVVVEHDNRIADFVNLAPNVTLAGGVAVGEGATVYSGAIVAPNVSIGSNAIVGAGALVLKDLPDNVIAYGSPARVIGKRS